MIAEINKLKQICAGDISKNTNYIKAINDDKHMWHLHHKQLSIQTGLSKKFIDDLE